MYNSVKEILKSEPFALFEWLSENFTYDIPTNIESEIEMRRAGNLMGELTNGYSFLCALEAEIAMHLKVLKTNKEKKLADLMSLRKTAVHAYVDILSKQYSCVSRMLTIKIEADKELHMSEGFKL